MITVEAAVSAARIRQATPLPPQLLLRGGYDLAKKLPTFTAASRRRAFGKRDRRQ